jgi:hypothetical protein
VTRQRAGQRVKDRINDAFDVLSEYGMLGHSKSPIPRDFNSEIMYG